MESRYAISRKILFQLQGRGWRNNESIRRVKNFEPRKWRKKEFELPQLKFSVFEGAAILKGWLANDVMSGVTYRYVPTSVLSFEWFVSHLIGIWLVTNAFFCFFLRSDGHLADPLQSRTFTSYLKVYLAFLLLTSSFNFSTAEHLIGK